MDRFVEVLGIECLLKRDRGIFRKMSGQLFGNRKQNATIVFFLFLLGFPYYNYKKLSNV